MRDKLVLRFLGFLETMKYILEQSHGVPPVSVALDHTTLKEEGSCGYSSVKTGRSIDGIHIISMSLGAPAAPAAMETICNTAWSKGLLLVAAAGNSGPGMG